MDPQQQIQDIGLKNDGIITTIVHGQPSPPPGIDVVPVPMNQVNVVQNLGVQNVKMGQAESHPAPVGVVDGPEVEMWPKYLFLIATALHVVGFIAEVHMFTIFISCGCHIAGYSMYMKHEDDNTKKWARLNLYGAILNGALIISYIFACVGEFAMVFILQIGIVVCSIPVSIICMPCLMIAAFFPPLMLCLIIPFMLLFIPFVLIPVLPLILVFVGLLAYSAC